ncbi:MAG TPA: ABC transporter substrate-binding protein [Chloroflexota bacterium]|nr:ABC transporter substrate-binding protein [Chloroflexota bacterium]
MMDWPRWRGRWLCGWGLVALVACSPALPAQPGAPGPPQPLAAETSSTGGSAAAAPPAAPTTVRLAVPTLDLDYTLPLSVAEQQGYFREEGIDVQVQEMPSAAETAALINRELDLACSGCVFVGAARGADVRYLFGPYYTSNFHLVVNPDRVRTPADLAGQPVAIGGVGNSGDLATHRILASLGVDPASVTYVNLGPSSARIAGMVSGQIAGTALLPDPAIRLKREGFPIIADSTKLFVQPQGGFGAHVDYLREHDATVKGWLRAMLRGLLFIQRDPAAAAEIAADATQLDRDVAREAVPLVMAAMSTGDLGGSTERELQEAVRLVTDSDPDLAGKDFPLDRVVDFRPLRAVQRELGISCQGGYACE